MIKFSDTTSGDLMNLIERIERMLLSEGARLGSKATAYHVGRQLRGGQFRISATGSGEAQATGKLTKSKRRNPLAFGALGPAVYFATSEEVAKLYTKYTRDQSVFLYTCSINTQNMIDEAKGLGPKRILDALAEERLLIEDRIKFKGALTITSMFEVYGMRETFKRLKSMGCTGQHVTFSGGPYGGFTEIAVYDPKTIKIEGHEELVSGKSGEDMWSKIKSHYGDHVKYIEDVEGWLEGRDREAPVESINKLIQLSINAYSIFDSGQRAAIIRHFDAALNAVFDDRDDEEAWHEAKLGLAYFLS